MSDCPANTTVSDQAQYAAAPADFVQGVINRLKSYWDKYDIATLGPRRISNKYARYGRDTSGLHYTKEHDELITEIQSRLNDYKDKWDNSGGDYGWTAVTENSKKIETNPDELRANLLSLEAQCWACHSGYIIPCSCDATCYGYAGCACDSSCYGFTCTCNAQCYGVSCTCNVTTHGFSCECYYSNYLAGTASTYPFCGCYNQCYTYSCTCHSACYLETTCYTCNAMCYGYVCSCNATCYAYGGCACNTTCYGYSCPQCYGTTY